MDQVSEVAFPQLTEAELEMVKPLVKTCDYADGETVFRVGQAENLNAAPRYYSDR